MIWPGYETQLAAFFVDLACDMVQLMYSWHTKPVAFEYITLHTKDLQCKVEYTSVNAAGCWSSWLTRRHVYTLFRWLEITAGLNCLIQAGALHWAVVCALCKHQLLPPLIHLLALLFIVNSAWHIMKLCILISQSPMHCLEIACFVH